LASGKGGPAKSIAPGPSAATGWPAPQAQAVLVGLAGALDLVAGWVFALDPIAPQRDERDLLAALSSGEQSDLDSTGRWLLERVPLAPGVAAEKVAALPASQFLDHLVAAGARTAAAAPIVVDDRPVGALVVASRRERSELAESSLGAAAGQVGLALEQAWRERELRAELHQAERWIRQLEASIADLGGIVSNLLDNAINYSAPEMPVSLTAEVLDREVRVSVADRGIGIALGDMGRLFQRFERIDPTVRSQPGTGLGLDICRQLAESMGGRIRAESVLSHGSTFAVGLRSAATGAAGPAEQRV